MKYKSGQVIYIKDKNIMLNTLVNDIKNGRDFEFDDLNNSLICSIVDYDDGYYHIKTNCAITKSFKNIYVYEYDFAAYFYVDENTIDKNAILLKDTYVIAKSSDDNEKVFYIDNRGFIEGDVQHFLNIFRVLYACDSNGNKIDIEKLKSNNYQQQKTTVLDDIYDILGN